MEQNPGENPHGPRGDVRIDGPRESGHYLYWIWDLGRENKYRWEWCAINIKRGQRNKGLLAGFAIPSVSGKPKPPSAEAGREPHVSCPNPLEMSIGI